MTFSNNSGNDSSYHNAYNSGLSNSVEDQPERTIKDYVFMVREKIWWAIIVFFLVVIGVLVYTFRVTPVYEADAQVRLLRDANTPIEEGKTNVNERISNQEDFLTFLQVLSSSNIIDRVENRIRDEEGLMAKIMQPYQNRLSFTGMLTLSEVLANDRSITPMKGSLVVRVGFSHTDPEIAAKVANYFADEFLKSSLESAVRELVRSAEELKVQAEHQTARVNELELKAIRYREVHNRVGVDRGEDIDREELSRLKQDAVSAEREYGAAKAEWDMIQDYKSKGQNLWDIDTIAVIPNVDELLRKYTSQRIEHSSLSKRYKEKHPTMIALTQQLSQTEFELNAAIDSAIVKVRSRYERAETQYALAQERLVQKEKEVLEIGKLRVEYNNILNEITTAKDLLRQLTLKVNSVQAEIPLKQPNVEIVSLASVPRYYKSPREILYISVGCMAGIFLGLTLALGLAIMDDRVKNLFDIEKFIGIPVVGVVPLIPSLTTDERARAVSNDSNQYLTEAFRSIHSTLKLNAIAGNAKVMIITSTIPGEGKSFVSSNLAQAYGIHEERVLLVDCDLRMPKLAETLNFKNTEGILQFLHSNVDEPFIHKDVFKNVDVILTGGSTRSASESLSNPKFAEYLVRAKNKYDRIILDSPPAGVVSDTYSVSKEVDGVIYVIKFNTVKRRSALYCVRKFKEAKIPVIGAVLNGIKSNLVGYYYHSYSYDKAYTKYYKVEES